MRSIDAGEMFKALTDCMHDHLDYQSAERMITAWHDGDLVCVVRYDVDSWCLYRVTETCEVTRIWLAEEFAMIFAKINEIKD